VLQREWAMGCSSSKTGQCAAKTKVENHGSTSPASSLVRQPLDALTDAQLLAYAPVPKPWPKLQFKSSATLQMCPRNQGKVLLMEEVATLRKIVVKQMPISWTGNSVEAFFAEHPESLEVPWMDMGITSYLNERGYPNCIKTVGVYHDEETALLSYAMEYAEGGDLYSHLHAGGVPPAGPRREAFFYPLIVEFLSAIFYLHALGIAHCDISLENVLITSNGAKLRIIDFGMATTVHQRLRARGKPSYRGPEVYRGSYDVFKADAFACGVVIYAMALSDYPWLSTQRGGCQCFEDVKKNGFRAHHKKRRLRGGKQNQCIMDVLSESLTTLIAGLVEFSPTARLSIAGTKHDKNSVWSCSWLSKATCPKGPGPGIETEADQRTCSKEAAEKVPELPTEPLMSSQVTHESAHGVLGWNLNLSKQLQASIDHIFTDNISKLRFSCTIADPNQPDCPIVALSEGFSHLTGYGVTECIGQNCRFLVDGVPPDLIDNAMRMKVRKFVFESGGSHDNEDSTNPLSVPITAGEKSLAVLPPGEIFVVQWNRKKDGELFKSMFYLKRVTLDSAPFIVGLQLGSDPDELGLQGSLSGLSDNMTQMEQMLASQFWYSAPMRRQRQNLSKASSVRHS